MRSTVVSVTHGLPSCRAKRLTYRSRSISSSHGLQDRGDSCLSWRRGQGSDGLHTGLRSPAVRAELGWETTPLSRGHQPPRIPTPRDACRRQSLGSRSRTRVHVRDEGRGWEGRSRSLRRVAVSATRVCPRGRGPVGSLESWAGRALRRAGRVFRETRGRLMSRGATGEARPPEAPHRSLRVVGGLCGRDQVLALEMGARDGGGERVRVLRAEQRSA